ncbi:hypothetical protein [Nocardia sp. NPDC050710]|uniref:hypothetical protein n=1 Tax=Nocardia sp. NPDC050710 TaxID=3157220 RepID=UPI0033CF7324
MKQTSFRAVFSTGGACLADPQPKQPDDNAALRYQAAGGLGTEVGAQVEPAGEAESGRSAIDSLAGVSGSTGTEHPDPSAPIDSTTGGTDGAAPPVAEPQPRLELRVRAIYAVDQGATPAWTLAQIQAAVGALVTAANRDLAGTGYRYVFFPKHDVEIRTDSKLRQDVLLSASVVRRMTSGQIGQAEGQKLIDAAALASIDHRNAVAAERPNQMLWLFSRGNRFEKVRDGSGKFLRWNYVDDRAGSFSGGPHTYVALHEGFLSSVTHARDDASRAVHEVGHYLSLWHTHREPFHDLDFLPGDVDSRPATERLRLWQRAIGTWLNQELPANSSVTKAHGTYDADVGSGVLDTPADPGAAILALANEAAGHGPNELGPITSVPITATDVLGTLHLAPLRDNPMGYYLRETPDAMRFTAGQVKVMRRQLIDGGRRPLVAAQLGDSATPDLRVCAVWSPSTAGQRVTWHHDLTAHRAEHTRMRREGFALVHQQAYTHNGAVVYDGIWDPGEQAQEILWGWQEQHVPADVAQRATRGMVPVVVQGYQHLDHGPRYNVIYEPGTGDSRALLGVTQVELAREWNIWSPRGYRMTCLSSHVDASGTIRHSTVLRKRSTHQEWVTGWTLEDIAGEYGRQWNRGWRIRHITLVRIKEGRRWSAVFEPDTRGQLVYWAHVRERISEVYDQQWASDSKLRSMCVTPA